MKSVRIALLLSASALLVVACAQPVVETTNRTAPGAASTPVAVTATPDEFATARATFMKSCVGCHGEDGVGGVKEVQGKRLKVPSFKEGHALKHSDEDFVKQIENGGDGMPQFKDKLSADEIAQLVRFVRKEFQGK